MNKPVRVILLDEADSEYKKLNEIVGQQIKEGKENTEEIQLLRSIKQKIEFIKANPFYGDNIAKGLIPKYYVVKYNAKNLWRAELINFWRMIYTIKGDQVEVICFVLDILSHKDYDKKFGYEKIERKLIHAKPSQFKSQALSSSACRPSRTFLPQFLCIFRDYR